MINFKDVVPENDRSRVVVIPLYDDGKLFIRYVLTEGGLESDTIKTRLLIDLRERISEYSPVWFVISDLSFPGSTRFYLNKKKEIYYRDNIEWIICMPQLCQALSCHSDFGSLAKDVTGNKVPYLYIQTLVDYEQ